jgi:hypothetical protein
MAYLSHHGKMQSQDATNYASRENLRAGGNGGLSTKATTGGNQSQNSGNQIEIKVPKPKLNSLIVNSPQTNYNPMA